LLLGEWHFEKYFLHSAANIGLRLQIQALKAGITIRRDLYLSLESLFSAYPKTHHFVNCTGLGSLKIGGVEDKLLYPSRVSAISLPESF
jgi:hypothetical protein